MDANGIVINPAKCVLGAASLEFLGHHVEKHSICPLEVKVEAVRQILQPQQKLHKFLRLVNFTSSSWVVLTLFTPSTPCPQDPPRVTDTLLEVTK